MAVSLSGLVAAAQLFGRSDASLSFKPNCTLPPPGTNYVAGPNVRSTTTILWNVLSIIILCTWNIQHLNVPGIRRPAKKIKWWQLWRKLWRAILDSRVKAKWMLFTIFIPEYVLGKALGEWVAARSGRSAWKRFDNGDWEMIHGYMANMGYFVLDWGGIDSGEGSETEQVAEGENQEDDDEAASHRTTAGQVTPAGIPDTSAIAKPKEPYHKHLSETVSEIIVSSRPTVEIENNLHRLRSRYWALNASQWARIFDLGICNPPDTTATQLEKLDKSGSLIKAIALVQVAYLVVQLIARKIGGLPSTQLEIAALAFSASACVTYCLYWNRPQGVETIYIMKAKKKFEGSRDQLLSLASYGPGYFATWYIFSFFFTPFYRNKHNQAEFDLDHGPAPIPNSGTDVRIPKDSAGLYFVLGLLFGGTLFGGLHCLAWDFQFPTPGEALGWRICAIVTTCVPLLTMLVSSAFSWMADFEMTPSRGAFYTFPIFSLVFLMVALVLLVTYVLARLFLLVEMFRSLFFLPPEAFVDTWSGSFPHWA